VGTLKLEGKFWKCEKSLSSLKVGNCKSRWEIVKGGSFKNECEVEKG
jgi:hypothetical protein